MHEVVKHHNDLNTIPMRNWNKAEMNFFFSIIAKLRDEGTKEVIFDKHGLADLANYTIRANKDYEEVIAKLVHNILSISFFEKQQTELNGKPAYVLKRMNLFSSFEAKWTEDLTDLELTVKVSDEFDYVVNRLDSEFTSYELAEFTQINSSYSKTVYRLLKQWRTVGRKEYSIDEFKRLLDTPDYYTPSHIDKNILEPVLRELPQFFIGLKVKKIKSNKRGTPVIGYEFSFQKEKADKWINGKFDKKNFPSTKPIRKNELPKWAQNDYQHEEPDMDDETRKALERRLAEYEKKKHRKN
ncbi:replication initiation protein [Enterococcus sp. AZ102]|uniref:replication initiation protein n=1 Tax=Enterococcus sp. AZ102 TaxID=2774865 RepID=UPI003F1F6F00